jgi:hypothetical protein
VVVPRLNWRFRAGRYLWMAAQEGRAPPASRDASSDVPSLRSLSTTIASPAPLISCSSGSEPDEPARCGGARLLRGIPQGLGVDRGRHHHIDRAEADPGPHAARLHCWRSVLARERKRVIREIPHGRRRIWQTRAAEHDVRSIFVTYSAILVSRFGLFAHSSSLREQKLLI